ncbi:Acetyltransferase (GNAT) family protein [Limimonas halophila]|uniref:Acetyltransferase (GNAT) family protein n=1 Tax=Limimonas halophila TaxID=1082479 RepID=A0A1G7RPS7_9PROT|nr:GNAT family N-acetyltransferase [Limimonas halophila]SDG11970.1 Acetyltransferase (GNAT) family protein [Limimonas halophila]
MPTVHHRDAEPRDVPLILRMIRELAEYEALLHAVEADEAALHRTLFAPEPKVFAMIVECDGEPAGFALYYYTYSTFQGKHGIYIEDLYIRPAWRNQGLGKGVFRCLADKACREDFGRIEWSVLDWNSDAIAFYERQGAVAMNEWIRMRLEGEAITALAAPTSDGAV